METEDETTLTEITILGDGRICVFGASTAVLLALADLCPTDVELQRRVKHVRAVGSTARIEVRGASDNGIKARSASKAHGVASGDTEALAVASGFNAATNKMRRAGP